MIVETALFGRMEIPDKKDDIERELNRCMTRFREVPIRYLQCRIDYLESALDGLRRADDV